MQFFILLALPLNSVESNEFPIPCATARYPLPLSSNLQVLMMKDLIERAVHHVARNARRKNIAPRGDSPESVPSPAGAAATRVAGSWWPAYFRVSIV